LKFSTFFFKTLKTPKHLPPRGQGGVSKFFGGLISPFFVRINPLNSYDNPFWDFKNGIKNKIRTARTKKDS
jgi:hypothetical protein